MRARALFHVVVSIAVVLSILQSPVLGQGGAPCAEHNCDANADRSRDISDAVHIFGFLFLGTGGAVPFCDGINFTAANGDCNGDDAIDLSDGIRLLSWLFAGQDPPVEVTPGADTD